jgi:hypothetical protein
MYAPSGNSEFCFPENLNVSRDSGNIEIRDNSLTKIRDSLTKIQNSHVNRIKVSS